MRRLLVAIMSMALVMSLAGTATAAKSKAKTKSDQRGLHADSLPNPLAEKQSALRQKGLERLLEGKATPKGKNKVVRIAKGQYVELARTGEDSILTILGEFGPAQATNHPASHPNHGGGPGPLHNTIEEPDRSVDNASIWVEDFSEAYYEELLFSDAPGAVSMKNFYEEMSSGRYSVNGDVTPWVQVPYNGPSYGSNYCGSIVCQDTWRFVQDAANAFADTFATTAALNAYLAEFDVWDRYDHDGDGNFNESDGYIDHFQTVHAGSGEEGGGGILGEDAIWSHRWYVQLTPIGTGGPEVGGAVVPFGGTQIGDSDYWIGDYTIEPEDGGLGVFAHEYAHDLNLPDLYDTSGNTGGAENSTGFWTLMSSGSNTGTGRAEDGIGGHPTHMGNWEKFQLGWLNYEVAFAGSPSSHRLGPSTYNTKQAQGVFIVLPDNIVPLDLGDPCDVCGTQYYYSGSGDGLNVAMTKTAGVSGTALTAKVRYTIELNWDFAFLEASTNGGTSWVPVATNLSADAADDESGFNQSGTGLTGDTGPTWADLTATLPAGTNAVRFRYQTDGAVVEPGFQVDNIAIDGTLIGTAEAEEGWAFTGFRTTTGSEEQAFFNAYVLENRQYTGSDVALRDGAYNFGWLNTNPDQVEFFPYQDGLLISYWNTEFSDNAVNDHPGGGLILPIDAHPQFSHWADGTLMRPRITSFDATFGLQRVPAVTFHQNGVPTTIPGKPAVKVFSDARSPWTDCDAHDCTGDHVGRYQPGWYTVDIPNTGTKVRVKSVSSTGFMQVDINK